MSRNITYNLNEANLRGMVNRLQFGFDETLWQQTEKNLESLGLQRKGNVQFSAKKFFLITGLLLVGGGLAAFINYSKNQRNNNGSQAFATQSTEEMAEVMGLKVTNEVPQLIFTRKAIEKPAPIVVADSLKTEIAAEGPAVENKVEDQKKEEKIEKKREEEVKETAKKSGASEGNHESKKKKKKKKKKRHSTSTDGGTKILHSAGEDDVIITD